MFRQKQKFQSDLVGVGTFSHPVVNPQTGYVERVKRSHCETLPDSSLFDPTSCIKAGVNLEQKNSKVFGIQLGDVGDEAEDIPNSQDNV